jgi:hypothetical protein
MIRFALALALMPGLPGLAHADTSAPSRLWNDGVGSGQCLDIVNDGANDKLTVTACADVSGQSWTLVPTDAPGYYRLQAGFTGPGHCLDVINDGANDRVRMATCANVTGQYWELTRHRGPGRSFQMTNRFTGPSRCLEATEEGLRLRSCARSPAQEWSSEWPVSG